MSKHHYCFVIGLMAGVILVLGFMLVVREPMQNAFAQTANSNNRMIAVTGEIESGVHALYLIDTDSTNPRLLVYEARMGRTLKLIAARDIQWDVKCTDFVNGGRSDPTVTEVKKAVEDYEKKKKKD
ncbi:MAG: hypothetical protein RDV41_01680 [Planctomycetota bacterium]|nr:hypothetical protein [Planctomycetota bacterium]